MDRVTDELCHRCHGVLPQHAPVVGRSYTGLEPDAMLFCPHCSAPQIRLPEHMRPLAVDLHAASTTGSLPPPDPRAVDWPVALRSAALVAAVGAALKVLALAVPPLEMVATPWVAGCSFLALVLYMRQCPRAWMDARTGLRIGAATGVVMVTALGLALAAAGLVARFGLHRMGGFDAELAQVLDATRAQVVAGLAQQNPPADQAAMLQAATLQAKMLGFLGSSEVKGGMALFYLAMTGGLVLVLAAAGGAFSGLLRDRRHAARQAD